MLAYVSSNAFTVITEGVIIHWAQVASLFVRMSATVPIAVQLTGRTSRIPISKTSSKGQQKENNQIGESMHIGEYANCSC